MNVPISITKKTIMKEGKSNSNNSKSEQGGINAAEYENEMFNDNDNSYNVFDIHDGMNTHCHISAQEDFNDNVFVDAPINHTENIFLCDNCDIDKLVTDKKGREKLWITMVSCIIVPKRSAFQKMFSK